MHVRVKFNCTYYWYKYSVGRDLNPAELRVTTYDQDVHGNKLALVTHSWFFVFRNQARMTATNGDALLIS